MGALLAMSVESCVDVRLQAAKSGKQCSAVTTCAVSSSCTSRASSASDVSGAIEEECAAPFSVLLLAVLRVAAPICFWSLLSHGVTSNKLAVLRVAAPTSLLSCWGSSRCELGLSM